MATTAARRIKRRPTIPAKAKFDPKPTSSSDVPLFERFAAKVARLSGRPLTFIGAVVLLLLWGLSGPLFGFSDTWQLIVNTSTTIITFLMVFLIQHTQNRDSLAVQIKLAEIILVMKGAENALATAEERSEEYLEHLRDTYREKQAAK